jgi:hypothetical protein
MADGISECYEDLLQGSYGCVARIVLNGHRRGDVRTRDKWVETCLKNSQDLLDVPRRRELWSEVP